MQITFVDGPKDGLTETYIGDRIEGKNTGDFIFLLDEEVTKEIASGRFHFNPAVDRRVKEHKYLLVKTDFGFDAHYRGEVL